MMGDLMRYSYNEIAALRHSGSFLAAFLVFLAFMGGYYSGQRGWWGMGLIFALVLFWMLKGFLTIAEVRPKSYDQYIRLSASFVATLFFLLIFLAGYELGPSGAWWPGLFSIFVYFILVKFIHKPYTRS